MNVTRFTTLAAAAILSAAVHTAAQAYTMMGNVISFEKQPQDLTFLCENGSVRLSFPVDGIIRVHMAPSGVFPEDTLHEDQNGPYAVVSYSWPGVPYEITESFDYDLEGDVFNIKAGCLMVKARKKPFKLAFYDSGGGPLVMEKDGVVDAGLGYEGTKVYETMHLPDDEHFFGFGAHNHPLDMRGQKIVCAATELDSMGERGGFPVPFFLSSRGYGLFFNNLDNDVTFEMGTNPGQYSFSATSGGREGWDMDYYIMYGPQFQDIMKRYIQITGPPILPEKWFFGHIQHHCCDWTAETVAAVAKKYREGNWPCDVLIMDYHALDPGFQWTKEFSGYKDMFRAIDGMGFKTGYSCALFDDLYDWKQYDPTVRESTQSYWSAHIPRVNDGIDFWRQDNSERSWKYTGKDTLANGYEAHELFGSLWAKNVVEGMESMGLHGRPVISRAGPIGGHRYIVPWPGDLSHGLEFLKPDMAFVRNGGLAGYAAIAVDLGGFIDRGERPPLEEQNIIRRTINIMPIIPISKCQGAGDASAKLPWLLTAAQQDLMRRFLEFRYRLHPYIYSAAIEANQTGRPILAPLVFDYQDDGQTYDKDYTFLLGRQLLAAPVMEEADNRSVYLPEGTWFHYWTGRRYRGGRTVTVDAPLYEMAGLPLFVKAGAVIPMMPKMSYIYEKSPEPITLDVWPHQETRGHWTVFDRQTIISPTETTALSCMEDAGKVEVTVDTANAALELIVHHDRLPGAVSADGVKLSRLADKAAFESAQQGWFFGRGLFDWSNENPAINIKLPRSSGRRTIKIEKTAAANIPIPPSVQDEPHAAAGGGSNVEGTTSAAPKFRQVTMPTGIDRPGKTVWIPAVIIAIGIFGHLFIYRLLLKIVGHTGVGIDDSVVKHCYRPLQWLAILFAIRLSVPFSIHSDSVSGLNHLLGLCFIGAVSWLAIKTISVLQDVVDRRFDVGQRDNLRARKIHTQMNVMRRIVIVIVMVLAAGTALMTFEKVRQLGTTILASAGIIGIVVGMAAQKTIGTFIAGLQIAFTQPIRVDDVVIVENEWGRIEEITLTYVVVRIWDLRRLVVPITYFIEKPFQNWTRKSSDILGTVYLYVDYNVPVDAVRKELQRILGDSEIWDKKVCVLQVTNTSDKTVEIRALVSASDASDCWTLRCLVREKLVEFIQRNYPDSLPKLRAEMTKPQTPMSQPAHPK